MFVGGGVCFCFFVICLGLFSSSFFSSFFFKICKGWGVVFVVLGGLCVGVPLFFGGGGGEYMSSNALNTAFNVQCTPKNPSQPIPVICPFPEPLMKEDEHCFHFTTSS